MFLAITAYTMASPSTAGKARHRPQTSRPSAQLSASSVRVDGSKASVGAAAGTGSGMVWFKARRFSPNCASPDNAGE